MLSSCVQSVKTYVAKALTDLSNFSFLYLDDKEKFVEVFNPLLIFGLFSVFCLSCLSVFSFVIILLFTCDSLVDFIFVAPHFGVM